MHAVLERDTGSLISVQDFDHQVSSDSRTFYYVGTIDGLVQSNYTVEHSVNPDNIVNNLPSSLPKISGQYAGFSIRDGVFECAASDISAREELYYTATASELIVSTDFFKLANAVGLLQYDESEVRHFITHGFCHKGKTTFKEIYRLSPGELLQHDGDGVVSTENYLNRFRGAVVTSDAFKNSLIHSIKSVIQRNPSFYEVVMFSGGVDSSVLLGLIKTMKDVSAITFRFIPAISWNEPDVARSERMAKNLGVPHEFVDVDLNQIDLDYLDDVILSMPFAAHLSIYFKKIFETLRSGKKRLWTGQDLDILYYYTATYKLWQVQRFLLSDTYDRMLQGVEGYQRYEIVKKMLDAPLKWWCRRIYHADFETPNSIEELIEYYTDSERDLALKVIKEQASNTQSVPTYVGIGVSKIRQKLFDELTISFLSGMNHKVQLQAKKLFNVEIVFAYSTPSMVHLFRNRKISFGDVLFAKRFMYRYERELGIPRSDFRQGARWTAMRVPHDWPRVFESTHFGAELSQKTDGLANRIGVILDAKDVNRLQKKVGILWINNVREKLSQIGVEPKWPIFVNGSVRA